MRTEDLKYKGETISIQTEIKDAILKSIINESATDGELIQLHPDKFKWKVNGKVHNIVTAVDGNNVWVWVDGQVFQMERIDEDLDSAGSSDSENSIAAPMPGKVIKVVASVGDKVDEGAPILIVEAMKMEHMLRAPKGGEVISINCAEGDQVDAGVALAEIEFDE